MDETKKQSTVSKRSFTKEFREMAYQTIVDRFAHSTINIPTVDPCKAQCIKLQGDKAKYKECMDNCDGIYYLEEVARHLHQELVITILDVIWGGGDIDPLPFEMEVRKRFSNGRIRQ